MPPLQSRNASSIDLRGRYDSASARWTRLLAAWCSGPRRSDEQPPTVRQSHVAAVGGVGAVAVAIAEHDDLGAWRDRVPCHAAANERIGAAGLDHPLFDGAAIARHVEMDPGMRIDP